jgi:hypothetical protein
MIEPAKMWARGRAVEAILVGSCSILGACTALADADEQGVEEGTSVPVRAGGAEGGIGVRPSGLEPGAPANALPVVAALEGAPRRMSSFCPYGCAALLLLGTVRAPAQSSPAAAAPFQPVPSGEPTRYWLAWTFLGLGLAATAGAVLSFAEREQRAQRWNSAACVQPGRTRGSICPEERDAIQDWDRWLLVSGLAAGTFLGGAIVTRALSERDRPHRAGLTSCALSWASINCSGAF